MKNLCYALIAMFAITATVSTTANADSKSIYSYQQDEKKPVKAAELPEAVKTSLTSTDYKGWEISEAFHVKKADGKECYEVTLKSADKTKTVKLDKDGKIVE